MRFRSTSSTCWMPFSRTSLRHCDDSARTIRVGPSSARVSTFQSASTRSATALSSGFASSSTICFVLQRQPRRRHLLLFQRARHPTLQMVEFVRDRDVQLGTEHPVDAALQVEAEPQCLVRQPPRRLPRFDGDEIRRRVPAEEDDQSDRRPQPPAQPRRHFLPPSFFASPAFARRRSTLRRSILRRTPFVSSISSVNTSSVVPTTRPWMPPLVTT